MWFDNMTTLPMCTSGTFDELTNTITTFGEYPIFMEGTGTAKMKTETMLGEEQLIYKLYKANAEGIFKIQMKVTSTKKKGE